MSARASLPLPAAPDAQHYYARFFIVKELWKSYGYIPYDLSPSAAFRPTGIKETNCKVRMIIEEVNAEFGIRTPIICTPEELMEIA